MSVHLPDGLAAKISFGSTTRLPVHVLLLTICIKGEHSHKNRQQPGLGRRPEAVVSGKAIQKDVMSRQFAEVIRKRHPEASTSMTIGLTSHDLLMVNLKPGLGSQALCKSRLAEADRSKSYLAPLRPHSAEIGENTETRTSRDTGDLRLAAIIQREADLQGDLEMRNFAIGDVAARFDDLKPADMAYRLGRILDRIPDGLVCAVRGRPHDFDDALGML